MPPLHRQPVALAFVAVGGALGSFARYGVTQLGLDWRGYPWGTGAVNASGAFILGFILHYLGQQNETPRTVHLRLLGGTGFCGAFTTYSSLAHDTTSLSISQGHPQAATWIAVQVVVGVVLAGLGASAARLISDRDRIRQPDRAAVVLADATTAAVHDDSDGERVSDRTGRA